MMCDDVVLQTSVLCKYRTMPLDVVIESVNLARYSVNGDGCCLYHVVTHQAVFIDKQAAVTTLIRLQKEVVCAQKQLNYKF